MEGIQEVQRQRPRRRRVSVIFVLAALGGSLVPIGCGDGGDASPEAGPTMDPADPTSLADLSWSGDGLTGFDWGADREELVERWTEILGPPDYQADDVGVDCGLDTRSVRRWDEGDLFTAFDHDGRLGAVSFTLDDVPHESGPIGEGALLGDLQEIEPDVKWGGPYTGPGFEATTYYLWTLKSGDTSIEGSLTGPPPDGRLDGFVSMRGPFETEGCGE